MSAGWRWRLMRASFLRLAFLGALFVAGARLVQAEIKVSHNSDQGLLGSLRLVLTPAAGESGWYRLTDAQSGPEKKSSVKDGPAAGVWTEFAKPVTLNLAPRTDHLYTVEYYAIAADGTVSPSTQKTYRIYRFNNPPPQARLEELRGQGIIPDRHLIHDQFDSVAMAPKAAEKEQLGPCTVGFNVYLPEDYYTNADRTKRYPVVYYLHGGRGSENSLLPELPHIQHAIETKLVPPMVYVLAQGGSGGWFYHDHCRSNSRVMMDTCITQELIAAVEARYRVRGDPGGRAIQGFSMGGFGALKYALLPEIPLFSSVVAFSPGLDGMGNGLAQTQLDGGITTHNLEIADLVERRQKQLASMGLFITHGAKGKELITIYKGTEALVAQLRQLGLPVTFYELKIGHGQTPNWDLKGDEALQFMTAHFR